MEAECRSRSFFYDGLMGPKAESNPNRPSKQNGVLLALIFPESRGYRPSGFRSVFITEIANGTNTMVAADVGRVFLHRQTTK